ncbi:EF-P lysine aminoacylase GenX [Roseospira marina]|uniref:EF-P lysine aminoacylase GenX n=1 Tax=Roseospira marina TaxID=140057 RepID=A0A5M6IH76_9PROT|nr:EF-P lysine aminoacylase EpmA [Roseospira marina]KAA5607267.1 EF-P lysine aminoacylase GenX [Roseospira marina]MBB4312580.1 lysyl-tRNA synthetase class 2 [Roseospira marina]MBB5085404.1 lysyl-tRNA synthetase class 2 [Roseospira marina]
MTEAAGGRPWWHPDVLADRRPILAVRGQVLTAVRRFFTERAYVEVETPALQISPGLEPHLRAFATAWTPPDGRPPLPLYLNTSPEFTMKKLVAGGIPALFQMARVYRDGERSATHHPEFTMLEWYRTGATYTDLMDETEALVATCQQAAGGAPLQWCGHEADAVQPWRRLSVAEAMREYAGVDLMACLPPHPARDPDPAPLAAEARRLGLSTDEGDRFDDVFFRIFLEHVEPRLGFGVPCLLYDYPICMAALSRPKANDARLAERFEVYVCGLELANAFGELTDAREQRARFEADMDLKQALYGERYPIDEDFLAALEHGLPECSGIALGIDRLVMLCAGARRIEDVLWAPVADKRA